MRPLEELGREMADAVGTGPSDGDRAALKRAVLDRMEKRQGPQTRRMRRTRGFFALAVAAGIGLVIGHLDRSIESSHTRGSRAGDAIEEEGFFTAPSEAERMLAFGDGSTIRLDPAGRMRVTRTSPENVVVALEAGRIDAAITPGRGRRWSFQAGPYRVEVLGTAFSLAWDSAAEEFRLAVAHGVVAVHGASLDPEGVKIRSGDSLVADRHSARAHFSVDASSVPQSSMENPRPRARRSARRNDEPASPTDASAADGNAKPREAQSWQALARMRDYGRALDEARALGIDALLSSLPVDDLKLLADVARYRRDVAVAHRALRALEARFGSTPEGALAPFLLGRVAMELEGNAGKAADYFQRYIANAPDGSMIAEARGRYVDALARAGRTADAERAAADYLKHHPGGPYAALARGLRDGRSLLPSAP